MDTEDKPGAAAIIWFVDDTTREKKVLVGKESKYLSDIFKHKTNFNNDDRALLNVMENLTIDDINYVKTVCREHADELESMIHRKGKK